MINLLPLVPAKAGTQWDEPTKPPLDSRFRGNERS